MNRDVRSNDVRSTSVNNVNNRNVNVNKNVNVNVDNNRGGCCGGGWDNDYHPVATAAAVTAAVVVTSAVVGSMVRTVPAGCVPVNYGGMDPNAINPYAPQPMDMYAQTPPQFAANPDVSDATSVWSPSNIMKQAGELITGSSTPTGIPEIDLLTGAHPSMAKPQVEARGSVCHMTNLCRRRPKENLPGSSNAL